MKEKILPAIKESTEDYEAIEKQIRELFKLEIYLPLLRELNLPLNILQNASDNLSKAISSGRIQFNQGAFFGKFSAIISKELKALGATWDRKSRTWRIRKDDLPVEIEMAINASASRFTRVLQKIDQKLQKFLPEEITDKLKIEKFFDAALYKVQTQFAKSVQGLTVAPELTKARRARIAEEYTNNLKLYIKDFTKKEIGELRVKVQKRAFAGNRYESLAKTIQESYGVSSNKAKFLARQETSLLMTKFKQDRYESAGVTEYIWTCVKGSPNHPVRPYHKVLDGKKFSWNHPPITDDKGNRNNPGQDYNCRCTARPIVKF